MGDHSGFYKGDKKKPKKSKLENTAGKIGTESVFVLPTILPKGKDKNSNG